MHPNPAFRDVAEEKSITAARKHGLGTLVINGADGPLISHIPFLLDEAGTTVEAHLLRSNPILRALDQPQNAALAVHLGDAYISPDWYGMDDQVPTLNYIAIHLCGVLARRADDQLKPHLDALSAHFEGKYDKVPWTSDKMSPGVMERMMRAIAPVVLTVESVESTWKLNQNKPDAARQAAAGQVSAPIIANAMKAIDED